MKTGAIRTLLSGKNYARGPARPRRHAARAGSSFKPFILAAAFEEGIPPTHDVLEQVAATTRPAVAGELVQLRHQRRGPGDSGMIDLYTATTDSVNVVFAQLIQDVGPRTSWRSRTGWASRRDALPVLVARDRLRRVTPLDLASGYQTLANGGVHCMPYAVREHLRRPRHGLPAPARLRPRDQAGDRAPGHGDAPGRRVGGTGHGRRPRDVAGGRQDRHGATATPTSGSSATRRRSRPRSGSGPRAARTRMRRASSAAPSRRRSGTTTCCASWRDARRGLPTAARRPAPRSPSPTSWGWIRRRRESTLVRRRLPRRRSRLGRTRRAEGDGRRAEPGRREHVRRLGTIGQLDVSDGVPSAAAVPGWWVERGTTAQSTLEACRVRGRASCIKIVTDPGDYDQRARPVARRRDQGAAGLDGDDHGGQARA